MEKNPFDINAIIEEFNIKGNFTGYETINNGHINSTYNIAFDNNGAIEKYVLQKINTNIFTDPDKLMSNIVGVTNYIAEKYDNMGEDSSRRTLKFIPCTNGKYYYRDSDNSCWRLYHFVDDVYTCNKIDSNEVFENAGIAFGDFQNILADYDSASLYETIENFHNTVSRFADFKKAVEEDKVGRLKNVEEEVKFAMDREKDAHVLVDLISEGKLPLRVTHNDTKLNNILFDNQTNKGICIIDLDTVMPGLSLYDFGDSIRFGANTAAEDEKDVSKVSLSLSLYESYVKGYLSSAKDALTDCEKEYLPFSAKLMTYECGIRFLMDYLNGDTYFKTSYDDHNLVRAHTQFALVADMEKKMDDMIAITKKYC